jgi:hypothetical protein
MRWLGGWILVAGMLASPVARAELGVGVGLSAGAHVMSLGADHDSSACSAPCSDPLSYTSRALTLDIVDRQNAFLNMLVGGDGLSDEELRGLPRLGRLTRLSIFFQSGTSTVSHEVAGTTTVLDGAALRLGGFELHMGVYDMALSGPLHLGFSLSGIVWWETLTLPAVPSEFGSSDPSEEMLVRLALPLAAHLSYAVSDRLLVTVSPSIDPLMTAGRLYAAQGNKSALEVGLAADVAFRPLPFLIVGAHAQLVSSGTLFARGLKALALGVNALAVF